MERRAPILPDPAEDAARWFARDRSGDMSEAQQQAFEQWLDADPAHRSAYEQCCATWEALDSVRTNPAILRMREQVRSRRRWVWMGIGGLGLAASVAAALLMPALFDSPRPARLADAGGQDHSTSLSTGVGEVSRLTLSDGSKVVLDAQSVIALRFGKDQRYIVLERGRAFFEVAHEARPFIVAQGGMTVRATGTRFVVDREGATAKVAMIEGSVVVAALPSPALPQAPRQAPVSLTAGRGLTDDGKGHWTLIKTDFAAEEGWMNGRLIFEQERIGRIAELVNRYSRQKIVISGAGLADDRLSAALRAGDAETFVSALVDLKMARVASRDRDAIVLTSP
ncbi:FecR domain-containing protein [Novosphingobium flavum]|uniref:FecR domain-containing protein n=1 Tax=Novosphingobium flavum TaxID=1778672 RepID=A0A7X1KLE6_9SPHN|nr:FecR domain-containing protein [Novosphingobium flavum]MBC2665504.1 FecR domain-containing protein [Novosphingobium flavum]